MSYTDSQIRFLYLKMKCIEKEVKLFLFLQKYPFMCQYLNDTPGCHIPTVDKDTTVDESLSSEDDFEDQRTCLIAENTNPNNTSFENTVDDNVHEYDTTDERILDEDVYKFLMEVFDMKQDQK